MLPWQPSMVITTACLPSYALDKSVFGVALCVNVQRNGQALPQSILGAMERLRELGEWVCHVTIT